MKIVEAREYLIKNNKPSDGLVDALERLDQLIAKDGIAEAQIHDGQLEILERDGHALELPYGYYGNSLTPSDYLSRKYCGAQQIEL